MKLEEEVGECCLSGHVHWGHQCRDVMSLLHAIPCITAASLPNNNSKMTKKHMEKLAKINNTTSSTVGINLMYSIVK